MALQIWSVFPEVGNIHGDAGNADALARRAGWRGIEAEVVPIAIGDAAPAGEPDAIVIGSGFDADAPAVLGGLRRLESAMRGALDAHVPLLAVGLGWELCSSSVEIAGSPIDGLGIFPGSAVAAARHTGDLVVESTWGRLVGYEYHLRDYRPATGERQLGDVVSGYGHASGSGHEGSIVGSAIGTAMRGPVLARNGALADHLVFRIADLRGLALEDPAPTLQRIDGLNGAIAARTSRALGLR
jgi:hypothetical protein